MEEDPVSVGQPAAASQAGQAQKRRKMEMVSHEWDAPIDPSDKCDVCVLPWVNTSAKTKACETKDASQDEWFSDHTCIFEVALETMPIQATNFGDHHIGCFDLPLPGTWLTVEALKFMTYYSLKDADSLRTLPSTIPLARVDAVSRKGIYCTIKPTLCFFVPTTQSYICPPGAFIEGKLPIASFPAYTKTIASDAVFDLPASLDHSDLQVFQRALLHQAQALMDRKAFLRRSFDRRPVTKSMTPSTTLHEGLITLSPHLMIRSNHLSLFCDALIGKTPDDAPWWPGGILQSRTGTGKTVMGCRILNHWWSLAADDKPLLLIAPTNMFSTWGDHLDQWTDVPKEKIFFCGGGHKSPSEDTLSTKCLIVISKALWSRKRNLHTLTYAYLLMDEVHIQMPPRRSFPKLDVSGAAIGLTATIVEDVDFLLLSNLRVLRQTYPHNAAIFKPLLKPHHTTCRIEATAFDPIAALPTGRYLDTKRLFVAMPYVSTESIYSPPGDEDQAAVDAYLTKACVALMQRYSLRFISQDLLAHKSLPPSLYNRIYLDLQRLFAGDTKVVDPTHVILPPGANCSTNPFVRLLKYKEDLGLDEEAKCPICRDDELTDPVTLGCKHSFCMECIQTWFNGPRSNCRKCPACRKTIRGGATSDGSVFHTTPKEKPSYMKPAGAARALALKTYLETFAKTPTTTKLVIGVRFPRVVKVVEGLVKTFMPGTGVKSCSANQTPALRTKVLEDFSKEDSDLRVLVVHYSVAGVGINLTAASHLLLYDDFLPHEKTQLKGRLVRMGQKNDLVTVTTLDSLRFEKSYIQRKATVLYELEKADLHRPRLPEPQDVEATNEPSVVSVTIHTMVLPIELNE